MFHISSFLQSLLSWTESHQAPMKTQNQPKWAKTLLDQTFSLEWALLFQNCKWMNYPLEHAETETINLNSLESGSMDLYHGAFGARPSNRLFVHSRWIHHLVLTALQLHSNLFNVSAGYWGEFCPPQREPNTDFEDLSKHCCHNPQAANHKWQKRLLLETISSLFFNNLGWNILRATKRFSSLDVHMLTC